MSYADQITAEAILNPESRHRWLFGECKPQMKRARAIYKLLRAAGIDAELKPWLYGGMELTFPCRDFRKAEAIADRCYVGESWWPTKGKTAAMGAHV